MKLYELIYLIPLNLSEEESKSFQEKVISYIQETGGTLKEAKEPIRQRLPHPIKKQSAAFAIVLNFHSHPEKIAEIEKKFKSEAQILRYMILAKEVSKAKIKAPRRTLKLSRLTLKPPETEFKQVPKEPLTKTKKPKEKVELKEIEKKLEEILNE